MIATSDFRKGAKLEYKGEPVEIIDFQHVKMGRGGAVIKTRMKSLKTGNVLEDTFRSGDQFETPSLEEKEMQYLYLQDGFTILWIMKHMNRRHSVMNSLETQKSS